MEFPLTKDYPFKGEFRGLDFASHFSCQLEIPGGWLKVQGVKLTKFGNSSTKQH